MHRTDRRARASRLLASALCCLGLASLGDGCKRADAPPTCRHPTDGSIVACVDGVAVTRSSATEFLEAPWWIPGSPTLPDPRRVAVDRAIRLHLFAAEAKRRGLALPAGAPDVAASWSQSLVADEARARGLTRETISDDEAKRHYEVNAESFNQIDELGAQLLAFTDAAAATQAWPEASKADAARWKVLATTLPDSDAAKSKSGERRIVAASDEDRQLLKMALTLRKAGAVGGPFQAGDGLWYLMRIDRSPIEHPRALDEVLRVTVKNALLDGRKRRALDGLEASLRGKARIEIYEDALPTIVLPAWK